jgi:conjugal transfer ATP-binding protein TraC
VTIDSIIETLKEQSEELENKQLQDRRKSDLAEMLEPFSSRGIVGKWFDGPLNLDFNKKFVVLELEELNSNPELREVVLLMIMSLIDIKLYFGDRSRPKLIIIDEAWQLLRGENTANFIETGYRRARKYKGSFVTITQSVMDFFREDNAGVGQAIISNSAYKFLLVQKKEDLYRAKKEGKLVLSDFELKLAETIHTVPGQYSEIFIKTDRAYGIGRLFVDKFTQYLYSTKPTVVQYIEDRLKDGMSLTEAIDMAIKENVQ